MKTSALRYEPGIDGIRALAVLAVIAYHLGWLSAPGGFLGVEVFFTISGYLITSILVGEYRDTGRINLRYFWKRRVRRLLPALFVFLAFTAAYVAAFAPSEVARVQREIFPALGYATNWYLIGYNESYFESFGRPSLWRHLWSLAIEEQFYIGFPLLFVVFRKIRGALAVFLVVVVALASTWWMARLVVAFEDPSRVYYGTDTRAAGLFVGVILGLIRHRLPLAEHRRRWPVVVGVGGLATLVWLVATMNDFEPRLYRGGFLVTSVATAFVIVGVVGSKYLRSAVGVAPLRWIGLRSYSLYLWHWPVVVFTRPQVDVFWDPLVVTVVRIVATFAMAEASYRWVEMPARDGSLARYGDHLSGWRKRRATGRAWRVVVTTFIAAFFLPIAIVLASPVPDRPILENGPALVSDVGEVSTPRVTSIIESVVAVPNAGATAATISAPPTTIVYRVIERATTAPQPTANDATVYAIGDSVMLGAVEELQAAFGTAIQIDALKARSWDNGVETLRQRYAIGLRDDIVVVHLGHNGPVNATMLDELVRAAPDAARIYILTIKIDRRWEGTVNTLIRGHAASETRVRVIEWKSLAESDRNLLARDNVHLSPEGQRQYSELVTILLGDISSCAATSTCTNDAVK